jgi:aldose 1-epimerase
MNYDSPDGDQNFPGNVAATVVFTLLPNNTLSIQFGAVTDKPTLVNLTEHTYFNLAGDASGNVLNQLLQINANKYTTTDSMLVPDGKFAKVAGTPLDFRKPTPIGAHINDKFPMLTYGHGYDFNYVLNRKSNHYWTLAAKDVDPVSARVLEIYTTQPGVQFYSGNWLNSSEPGVGGAHYGPHDGFALECQHFPDSPNHPNFPSTELDPEQMYHQEIEYYFSTIKN